MESDIIRERMVALQEEIDWVAYVAFGLAEADAVLADEEDFSVLTCPRGSRPFEIARGRRSLVRKAKSAVPLDRAEIPPVGTLPDSLAKVWAQRVPMLTTSSTLAAIERIEFKRIWRDTDDNQVEEEFRREFDQFQLAAWLLDRLEEPRHWPGVELVSCAQLADRVRCDAEFLRVAEIYRGHAGFDLTALVTELVVAEAVPFLPVLRYTSGGLRKREQWERTWELQRAEDAGESVGDIPVPPKYTSADFLKSDWWRLRGKLDVAKERFVLYPGAERDADPTPVIAWAGWDHVQQAQALAARYVRMRETEGWPVARLLQLLAGLRELLPWLRQWHNELDPEYGVGLGDYFRDFIAEEARALGVTEDDLRAWAPEKKSKGRKKKAAKGAAE